MATKYGADGPSNFQSSVNLMAVSACAWVTGSVTPAIRPAASTAAVPKASTSGFAIQSVDGKLTTLKMPTGLSERQAISQLLSISLGVGTITPGQSENLLDFINTVDRRLYQAKQNGRNCIVAQDNEKTLAN